jgi:hypothetical protein
MKKLLAIIVLGLLFSSNVAFADISVIEEDWAGTKKQDYATRIVRVCIDKYEYVIVRSIRATAAIQSFEQVNGKSLPKKCN